MTELDIVILKDVRLNFTEIHRNDLVDYRQCEADECQQNYVTVIEGVGAASRDFIETAAKNEKINALIRRDIALIKAANEFEFFKTMYPQTFASKAGFLKQFEENIDLFNDYTRKLAGDQADYLRAWVEQVASANGATPGGIIRIMSSVVARKMGITESSFGTSDRRFYIYDEPKRAKARNSRRRHKLSPLEELRQRKQDQADARAAMLLKAKKKGVQS